jgi:hypothetical protein
MRSKKLHRIKQIQNLLSSPFINAQGTTEEILQQNSANPALMKAIQGIKHIVPDQPLKKQLDDIYTKTRQAITNTDALHNKQIGCDPADHKKWGGACAATCIEVESNVVRAIQGGLRSLCTPLLLFNHF